LAIIAMSTHAKAMAEDMYRALWSWIICVLVTVVVSLMTKPKSDSELNGLVYGVTAIPKETTVGLIRRPIFWAGVAAALLLLLQWIFW
jgi:SSS family solute:Na+ symporter